MTLAASFTSMQLHGSILRSYSRKTGMLPLADLNTTVSMLFMPLHPSGEHSQCTTNYTDITAAAGPDNFELQNMY